MRRRLAGASTAIGVLLGGIAVVFVGQRLTSNWDEVSDSLSNASFGWIAVAVVLAVIGMTAIAIPWRKALRLLGGDLSYPETIARYYVGELGKYLPGGVWPVVGRGELARRGGVGRTAAYGSVALSLAALYLAAMFLAVGFAPVIVSGDRTGGDGGAGKYLWALALLPVGLLCLHHAVLERVKGVGEKVLKREISADIPVWRDSLGLVVRYVPAWLFIGTATWAIAEGLGQHVGWLDVAPAAILSWIIGFVFVPVPGGVGVREAAFIAAAGSLAAGPAAAVAIVARVLFVATDGLGALASSTWLARQRTGGSSEQAPVNAGSVS
jgi:uncharacterized membrane protein YbhN (UPF0104 family)